MWATTRPGEYAKTPIRASATAVLSLATAFPEPSPPRSGLVQFMARLLYGCGLRLLECCQLRVKDVHLARGQIVVRAGKGNKDRVVMLPRSERTNLERQLDWRAKLHERDLSR